ncbi:heavy metal translocating P-type ATPase [Chryseobacterium sp. A301]
MSKSCCGHEAESNSSNLHTHRYDAKGRQLCCQKAASNLDSMESEDSCCSSTPRKKKSAPSCCAHEDDSGGEDDSESHEHSHAKGATESTSYFSLFKIPLLSFALLLVGLLLDHFLKPSWFVGPVRIVYYLAAYLPVAIPVLRDAVESIRYKEFFSEFFLMGIATLGAIAIGEYPEAVAVMLFYSVGEVFQGMAVRKARGSIKELLDQRPEEVTVIREGVPSTLRAKDVEIGEVIRLKPGEQVSLDSLLLSTSASFNTAALTGESKPDTKREGEIVLAGMVNLGQVTEVKVTTAFKDSKLSKILKLVQEATAHKAPTELFIRKFSKVYTPIVVYLAIGITILPALWVENYVFSEWLYRALVFLVISCPCALVISIPLGYFGGIGAASKNGILIKGSNFLDVLAAAKSVVMDKTGTLTKGVFKVVQDEVLAASKEEKKHLLTLVNTLESHSTHPIASAIKEYAGEVDHSLEFKSIEEVPGHGLKAVLEDKTLLVGNFKLLRKEEVSFPSEHEKNVDTVIAIAFGGVYKGYLTLADELKEQSHAAIAELHQLGLRTTLLSGDKEAVAQKVAAELGIKSAYGGLLPEDKVAHVKTLGKTESPILFVGDGMNDAPVLALSDVGIAMGGLGSDAAIETADVVIQDDNPLRVPMAIKIGKATKSIVWQNIILAFGVKAIVLALGAGGIASMWEAVFADVGVALLAILNAVRIQNKKF